MTANLVNFLTQLLLMPMLSPYNHVDYQTAS